jgi:excinuclease ABC subunit B
VIFYADKITKSMEKTISETNRRREKQIAYNLKNNITPTTIERTRSTSVIGKGDAAHALFPPQSEPDTIPIEPLHLLSGKKIDDLVLLKKKALEHAVKELDFLVAAKLRDEIEELKRQKKK